MSMTNASVTLIRCWTIKFITWVDDAIFDHRFWWFCKFIKRRRHWWRQCPDENNTYYGEADKIDKERRS